MYIDTGLEDIKDLQTPIVTGEGVKIRDVLRFCKGDGLAAQFEAGQQKGGAYFCWMCGINANRCDDITHSYYLPSLSLEERRTQVLQTTRTSNLSCQKSTKLYSHISKDSIVSELHQRGIKFR